VTNANSNSNPNDDLIGLSEIVLTKYAGPTNIDNQFANNCSNQGGDETLELFVQSVSGFVSDYWPFYAGSDLYASYDISSFSEFWLHGSSNLSPLSVSLTSFNANCQNDDFVKVSWETGSEMNASHFIVERSRDGISWSNEQQVTAVGNSNTINSYTFEDHNAGSDFEGYYRLRQVDFDGEEEVFGPISINCDKGDSDYVEVYPNPSNGNFNVRVHSSIGVEKAVVNVYTSNGSLVHQQMTNLEKGLTTLFFEQNQLEKGMYFIQIESENSKLEPQKLIIH
jgi:hypothetical protein